MRQNKIELQGGLVYTTPTIPLDHLIAGYNLPEKDQYWRRQKIPENFKQLSVAERNKIIDSFWDKYYDGYWLMINGVPTYMPPRAWWFFNCWSGQFDSTRIWKSDEYTEPNYAQFRQEQLRNFCFEEIAESTAGCLGTMKFKQRRDGATLMRVATQVFKGVQAEDKNLGIISQNNVKAKTVCWAKLIRGFKRIPSFFKPEQDGTSDPKTMLVFKKPSIRITRSNLEKIQTELEEDSGLNVVLDYRATATDSYDGDKLLDLLIDEFAKFRTGVSPKQCFETHRECIKQGANQVGHIHIITSPRELTEDDDDKKINPKAFSESIEVFKDSDITKLNNDGTTSSGLWAWFAGAQFSYEGYIDRYGFCDVEAATEKIMAERAKCTTPQSLRTKILQHPLSIEEVYDSETMDCMFQNAAGITARKHYIITHPFKDKEKEDPRYIFGNYNWKEGLIDTKVRFYPSNNQTDYTKTGKWKVPYYLNEEYANRYEIKFGRKVPPKDYEFVIGVDSYDYRRVKNKNPSKGAGHAIKVRDFFGREMVDVLHGQYLFRPTPTDFYEDMIKWAVYLGARVQIEAKNMNIADHFEDRGYWDFLLNEDLKKKNERKGNPTTPTLIQEICTLIDEYTSQPLMENEPYLLDTIWFEDLFEDLETFDSEDTQKSHLTMALGQTLLGRQKLKYILRRSKKQTRGFAEELMDYLAD